MRQSKEMYEYLTEIQERNDMLLEGLRTILNGNVMQGQVQFTHADVIQKHYQIARNAIAKAEGRIP